MKPLIEPAAFLEAFKYANPLPPTINLEINETPTPVENNKSGGNFWIILGTILFSLGIYQLYYTNKNHLKSKNIS